jgi:hypothetical protein
MQNNALIKELEKAAGSFHPTSVIYTIQFGDTLSGIISDFYNIHFGHPHYPTALTSVLYFNPKISNPNNITAGDTLRLMPIPNGAAMQYCPVIIEHNKSKSTERVGSHHVFEPMHSHSTTSLRSSLPVMAEDQKAFLALTLLKEELQSQPC